MGRPVKISLNYDVVIVDEASMIDLMLMQGLTDAIKPGTRLIIVGDYDQLPFRRCRQRPSRYHRK